MEVQTYNKTTMIGNTCLARWHPYGCFHEVRLKGEWGLKHMQSNEMYRLKNVPEIANFLKTAPCQTGSSPAWGGYTQFQVGEYVVSMSNECEESDPCGHSFKLDGEGVNWCVDKAANFFRAHNYPPPPHLQRYGLVSETCKLFSDNDDY